MTLSTARRPLTPAAPASLTPLAPPVERWEYRRVPITNVTDEPRGTLNDLGAEGWELVQISAMHYWLKRRLHAV